MENANYQALALVTGAIGFLGIWIYAFVSWGFLLGLAFGWVPALVGGFILGLLWPVVVPVVGMLLVVLLVAVFL